MDSLDIDPYWDSDLCSRIIAPKVTPLTKLNLVLDLDATLVSTTGMHDNLDTIFTNPNCMDLRNRVYWMDIGEPGNTEEIFGVIRPHVFEFLDYSFRYFENIFIWSSGDEEYVVPVCEFIFRPFCMKPKDIFTGTNCEEDKKHNLHKPLSKLEQKYKGITLKNTILIDDLSQNAKANPNNLIKIPKYDPKPTISGFRTPDNAFLDIMNFLDLRLVRTTTDIRNIDKSNIFQ